MGFWNFLPLHLQFGSFRSDTLFGGPGRDWLFGLRGADTLDGAEGDDILFGGRGRDVLIGGGGHDTLFGGKGRDLLEGGAEDDLLFGGRGRDTLDGGSGSDRLYGGRGRDLLIWDAQTRAEGDWDVYSGGRGRDTLRLELGLDDWLNTDFQQELAEYLAFSGTREGRRSGEFEFASLGLVVSDFERLEITVEGVALDPADALVTAADDAFAIGEKGAGLFGSVLDNDSVEDLVRAVQLVSGPEKGALTFNASGTFHYDTAGAFGTLGAGQSEDVTFTYRVTDADGDTDTATVTLTVQGENDAPEAVDDDNGTDAVIEAGADAPGDSVASGNLLANDSDPDAGDVLQVVSVSQGVGLAAAFAAEPGAFAVDGTYGRLTVTQSGDWTYILDQDNPETDALETGETATEVFDYVVADGAGARASAQLVISIEGNTDNTAPVATADRLEAIEGATVPLDVLSNDSDAEADALFVAQVNGLAIAVGQSIATTHGQVTLQADGTLAYQASDPDYSGPDSFTYRASDGALLSEPADVTLDVIAAADAPSVSVIQTGEALGFATFEIQSALSDTDGSETLALSISGLPTGASFAGGTQGLQADGSLLITDPNMVETVTVEFDGITDLDFALTATAIATEQSNGATATASASADIDISYGAASNTIDMTGALGEARSLFYNADYFMRFKSGLGNFDATTSQNQNFKPRDVSESLNVDLSLLGGDSNQEVVSLRTIYDNQLIFGYNATVDFEAPQATLSWDARLVSQYNAATDTLFLTPEFTLNADGLALRETNAETSIDPIVGYGLDLRLDFELFDTEVFNERFTASRRDESIGTFVSSALDAVEVDLFGVTIEPRDAYVPVTYSGSDLDTEFEDGILTTSFRHDGVYLSLQSTGIPGNPFGRRVNFSEQTEFWELEMGLTVDIDQSLVNAIIAADIGTQKDYMFNPGALTGHLTLSDGTVLEAGDGQTLVIDNASARLDRALGEDGMPSDEFIFDFDFEATGAQYALDWRQDSDWTITLDTFDFESGSWQLNLGGLNIQSLPNDWLLDVLSSFGSSTSFDLSNPNSSQSETLRTDFETFVLTQAEEDYAFVL